MRLAIEIIKREITQRELAQKQLNITGVSGSDKHELFYKWNNENDVYCARVIIAYDKVSMTGNYYKNGKVYALYQPFIKRNSDIQISEKEFNKLLGF